MLKQFKSICSLSKGKKRALQTCLILTEREREGYLRSVREKKMV